MQKMKWMNNILGIAVIAMLAFGCDQGIDPISALDPGPDETAPQVIIRTPTQGYQIQAPEAVAPVDISFEVSDDIELASVVVSINGNQIATFGEFIDYRRFIHSFTYDSVPTGAHELQITATDLEGKSTTESRSFEKIPPYTPKYADEIFYMPFDGDFMDMISFESATVTGSPGFSSQNIQGGSSYQGVADSYLTFPAEDLQTNEFT